MMSQPKIGKVGLFGSRIDFHVVTGVLGVERGSFGEAAPAHPDSVRAWQQISDWVRAASVVARLKGSRTGFIGHTYPGMLDMYSDFTQHSAQLGTHVEVLEMCDLAARLPRTGERAVAAKLRETKTIFDISKNSPFDPLARAPKPDQLQWACRVAVALDRLVADFDLHGLAYYYRGLRLLLPPGGNYGFRSSEFFGILDLGFHASHQ